MFNRWDLLSDVKILDISRIFTGPFCSQILSDLGAEVIKVEPPSGDDTRYWGPPFVDDDLSTYFASLNRNKTSKRLNLKLSRDYSEFEDLIKWADVIIENFRPGVTSRLKVDYDTVRAMNDNIIYLSITGYGSTGPYAKHASYDNIAQSESGLMSITGTTSGEVTKVGVPVGDLAAGMYGAIGILTALRERDRSGKGQRIETTLFGSLTSWLTYQGMNAYFNDDEPQPMGTAHPNIVPYQSFMCKDNQWITIAIANNRSWQKFREIIKHDELEDEMYSTNRDRVKNRDRLIPHLQKIFIGEPSTHWMEILGEANLAFGRVNTVSQVLAHPQIQHTNQLHYINMSGIKIPMIVTPISFSHSGVSGIDSPPV